MGLFKYLKEKFKGKKEQEEIREKYVAGLDKSRKNFSSKLNSLAKKYVKINSEYFDELEEILIEADVGVRLTSEIISETEKEAAMEHIDDPAKINELLVDKMFISYVNRGEETRTDIQFKENGPTVLMMVGVNGSGKTTTIAKLTKRYQDRGKKVLLIAGDTFRAAAVEQLQVWADRLNCQTCERTRGL